MGTKTTAFCKSIGTKIEAANKLIEGYQSAVFKYNDWLNNLGPGDYLNVVELQKQMMLKNPESYKDTLKGHMKNERQAIYDEAKKFKEYITKKKVLSALSGGFKTKASVGIAEAAINDANECVKQLDLILQ